ncbi:MAG: hypothetical protein EP338_09940 [Bacteroidetes bacterium]|nr:MAG: hypothetical protein EP338_09940 [Bacteroidota bacterium]
MAAPNITSVQNNPANMNSKILISGSNFTGAQNVLFGSVGTPPNLFVVNDKGTEISLTLPQMPSGTVYPLKTTVQVIVPGEPQGNKVPLTILNPTKITGVSSNPALVGNTFSITGEAFKGAVSVTIGTVVIPAASFTINELGTQITLTIPQMGSGTQYPFKTLVTVNMPTVGSNSYPITLDNPTVVNKITLQNNTKLDPNTYTVWVAGFIEQQLTKKTTQFLYLQADGKFKAQPTVSKAPFINVDTIDTLSVPNVESAGNNRLVILITEKTTTPAPYSPTTPYAAYPFKDNPDPCPPGPYDIFEFGPIAQYDVSAVDSFGLNLSFTVTGDPLTYGSVPAVSREEIGEAFTNFCNSDPLGKKGFGKLLYASPGSSGYPILIDKQFSAIVSPKDWLTIYATDSDLINYWEDTVNDFFASGNQVNFQLNAANVGNYSGSSDGTQFTLKGPNGMQIKIPASDFTGIQGFVQAVRGKKDSETELEYKTFGQIEAAIFEAISRGVALDGVMKAGKTIPQNYSSDAWTKYENWYTNTANSYNGKPRIYDAYAKFFHCGKFTNSAGKPTFIFGENGAQKFGMAYGFSLDEDPNVGTWPDNMGVPAKTVYYVGFNQDVALEIGRFLKSAPQES